MSRPIAIDPRGCGCTECLTGEYVPLDQATSAQIALMAAGLLANNTGESFSSRVSVWTTSAVEPQLRWYCGELPVVTR